MVVARVEAADSMQIERWVERFATASTFEAVLDPA